MRTSSDRMHANASVAFALLIEGLRLLARGDVDSGATDMPFVAPRDRPTGCAPIAIPMVSGSIAIAYNLPGASPGKPLRFDVRTLADIYSGRILRWNAVHDDTSGVQWPVDIAVEGNQGVASEVKATLYAIGFMVLAYARQNRSVVGSVISTPAQSFTPGGAAPDIQLPHTRGSFSIPRT